MKKLFLFLLLFIALPTQAALFTEDFNRADSSNDLGANWTDSVGVGLGITSNACYAGTIATSLGSRVTGVTQADDQYAEMTIQAGAGSGRYFTLYLRATGTDGTFNGYKVAIGGTNELYISEYLNGTNVNEVTSTFAFTDGVRFRAEAEGTTLRLLLDDVVRFSTTDATYTSGNTGIEIYNDNDGTVTNIRVDDFEAGDIGGGGGENLVPTIYQSLRQQKR